MKLKDKVAIVTGANHGIGAATARALAEQGASVFITYLGKPAPELVVQEARDKGVGVDSWEADLADPANIPKLFDKAEEKLGPVDIVVNNAAYGEPDTVLPVKPKSLDRLSRPIKTVIPESFDKHFTVNARAVVLMMAEYVRRYVKRKAKWGRIINVSTAGAYCFPGEISYGASKAALEAYTRSVAMEVGKLGITVNAVSPGPVHTGSPSYITPEIEKKLIPTIPLRRVGQPSDIADVVAFLASDKARWITGQIIKVSGGT